MNPDAGCAVGLMHGQPAAAAAAATVYSAGQCLHTACRVAAGGQALNPALIRCDCLQDAAKDLPPSAVEDLEVGQRPE